MPVRKRIRLLITATSAASLFFAVTPAGAETVRGVALKPVRTASLKGITVPQQFLERMLVQVAPYVPGEDEPDYQGGRAYVCSIPNVPGLAVTFRWNSDGRTMAETLTYDPAIMARRGTVGRVVTFARWRADESNIPAVLEIKIGFQGQEFTRTKSCPPVSELAYKAVADKPEFAKLPPLPPTVPEANPFEPVAATAAPFSVRFMDLPVKSASAPYHPWDPQGVMALRSVSFEPVTVGDTIVFAVNVPQAGRYRLQVTGASENDQGRYVVLMDGKVTGPEIDLYERDRPYGSIELSAGEHIITYRLTGKNPKSGGFAARLLRLDFTPDPM